MTTPSTWASKTLRCCACYCFTTAALLLPLYCRRYECLSKREAQLLFTHTCAALKTCADVCWRVLRESQLFFMETCASINKIQCSSSFNYMCRPSNRCCVCMQLTCALLAADMLYLLLTYCSMCRGEQPLPPPIQRNRMLTYAAVSSNNSFLRPYSEIVCGRMLTYAAVSREQQLPPPIQRNRMRTYADVCCRVARTTASSAHTAKSYADVCCRVARTTASSAHTAKSYADVCWRMLTYAAVSREQQLPPPKQRSRMRRQGFARLLQVWGLELPVYAASSY